MHGPLPRTAAELEKQTSERTAVYQFRVPPVCDPLGSSVNELLLGQPTGLHIALMCGMAMFTWPSEPPKSGNMNEPTCLWILVFLGSLPLKSWS